MPINTPHPLHREWSPRWERCVDFYEGADAVKEKGQTYLPELNKGHDGYGSYKKRALFYGATSRTVDSIVGAIFRNHPTVDGADPIDDDLVYVDGVSTSLNGMAMRIVRELLITGRCAIAMTIERGRVVWKFYRATDILTWGDDKGIIDRICLREDGFQQSLSDPWIVENAVTYRTYEIGVSGAVVENTYDNQLSITGSDNPAFPNQTLMTDELPVVIINSHGIGPTVSKPPILGLVNLNMSHYNVSADMSHGLHWVALPTIYALGATRDDLNGLSIGSSTAWAIPSATEIGMLEVKGPGFESIDRHLKGIESKMAAEGARVIEDQNRQAETAEAVRIKTGADAATAMEVIDSTERGINKILNIHSRWAHGIDIEPSFTINRSLFDSRISSQDAEVLMKAVQAGYISRESFYEALRSGEWVDVNKTFEEEQQTIETSQETGQEGNNVEENA